uniref:Uncharacterized protein n=1 Tax=Avena sativa TaxID=4498 RepID=A0ACD5V339_AVESA
MEGGGWSLLHSPALARLQEMFLLHTAGFLDHSSDYSISQYLRKWPEVYSPCFWTSTFALIQLVFITSIVAQFLFNRIRRCRQRLKTATPETHKDSNLEQKNADIKLGVSYQASKVCCLLILLSHVMRISFLQLRGRISGCKYPPFVLGEVLQALSWIILSLTVFRLQKTKSAKHQLTIRVWWVFNFLQSIISVIFDLRFSLSDHEYIGYAELIDLFTLVAGTYLFAISVRGKTGITLINSSITEPLLTPSAGQQTETKRTSLYGGASVLDLVTFSWMSPLFAIGYKKPLDNNDVPDIDGRDYADLLSDSFKRIIADVECRHGISTLSIYRAMFLFISREVAINATFAILCACASYVGPSLINDLVTFLGGKREYGLEKGYLLAVAILSAKVVETVAQRMWIFGARKLGMRLRAALISHIYQKGLRLSCSARQKHTSGEIINYMSVDIQRITDVIWYMNYIRMLPIQLSLAVYILHQNLGAGAWAGLAATLAIMACNIPLTRLQKRLQSKIMTAKDNRMKATTEVLRSIKILKLQAWDTEYLQKLEALRRDEHNWLWKSVRLTALTTFIFWGSPAFISSITFGTCILMGVPLTAGTVLSALATFRMLQDPIFALPDLLSVFAQGKVSADRVAQYLQEDELKSDTITEVPRNDTDYDVEIDHGAFSWEFETTSPTITDVNLKVTRGMKVAICGMVGSGKSSLLSCILGEMPKLAGNVRVSGRKAYVPQTAWILSGNIRENILFGNPYDKEKYQKIIQACALTKDLELFANGDLTEIGERGINMSGGQKQRIQIARSVYEDADIYLFDDPFSAVDAHTGGQLFKDCLMGMLKDKTILYVTHQVEFLPAADLILVMQDGKIVQKGTFDDLLQQNIGFEAIVGAHSQAIESVVNVESSSRILSTYSTHSDDEFEKENDTDDQLEGIIKQDLANNHSRPWFHSTSAFEWLCFRLNMLSNFVFAFSLTLLVSLPEGFLNPSIAGLAVTYALNLNGQLSNITWNICDAENKMISVERIMQYSRIPNEAPLIVDDHRPPNSWPKDGTINIRNLEVRYAEHLPSVLRNISCTIPGRKKVGIVGRTGSGKSTLIQALFRIVEPRVGTIEIDNVDLSKIGLHDLRGRLSIIPQDPTMFEGTVKGNLDPLNEYSDQHIWETLDKCQLGDIVRQSPKKLDSIVVENGENWSVGQRQLFCLGRVLLKRSNVLVLDEATASVDSSTDAIIQQTLREEFGDCTVLTVAHRIHTVIDSDLILVFSEGRIIEYDTPSRLLEDEKSEFSRLIKEYSRRSKDF